MSKGFPRPAQGERVAQIVKIVTGGPEQEEAELRRLQQQSEEMEEAQKHSLCSGSAMVFGTISRVGESVVFLVILF